MRWQLASTFAAMAMSGCYEEATVPCPNGVLCPADQACTGNAPSDDSDVKLCANTIDVESCIEPGEGENCDGAEGPGLCAANVCEPCVPSEHKCLYESWTALPAAGLALNAVFMYSPDRAYAVGSSGAMLTYDGHAWSPGIAGFTLDTQKSYSGVWASDTKVYVTYEALAVSDGTIVSSPDRLNEIWGRSPDDIVAVGTKELIGDFDGTWSWGPVAQFGDGLYGVWGWDDGFVAVGGDTVFTRSGSTWTKTNPVPDDLVAVWGTSKTDYYAVGNSGGLYGRIWHFTGTWTDETPSLTPTLPPLTGIWGSGDGPIYAIGLNGTILQKTGTTWTVMPTPDNSAQLTAISGSGRSAVAVGLSGEIWRISQMP